MTTAAAALEYKQRVLDAVPAERRGAFTPLMTCYLTDNTQPEDVQRAKEVRRVGACCGFLLSLQLPLAVMQLICHWAGIDQALHCFAACSPAWLPSSCTPRARPPTATAA